MADLARLLTDLPRNDVPAALRLVRAYRDALGDVPAYVLRHVAKLQDDPRELAAALEHDDPAAR